MVLIPVAPIISSVTDHTAVITRGADGNGPGVFYNFQVTYNVNLSTQIKYLKSDGTFSDIPVWMNVTSITATALLPNTLFSVRLSAADDATGLNDTGYGPAATFTTAAAVPIFQPFSAIYSTEVTANWLPNFNDDTTEYYVQLSSDPAFIFNVINSAWVTDNSYIFTNLLPNTIYYGQVKARNSVNAETSYITLGSVTTPAGPAQVQGIRSTNLLANRGFIIQWSANVEPNIALYRVYRSSSPTDDPSFQVIGTTPANVTSFIDNVPYTFGITWYYKITALDNGNNESSLELTSPVQDMSFSQFIEQPFPTTVQTNDLINQEKPSGQINHVNTLFTTTYPYKKGTLNIYLNGAQMILGIDYVENIPQQFTMTDAPISGDVLRVSYLKF